MFLKHLEPESFPSTMSSEDLFEESILRDCFPPGDVLPRLYRQRFSTVSNGALILLEAYRQYRLRQGMVWGKGEKERLETANITITNENVS